MSENNFVYLITLALTLGSNFSAFTNFSLEHFKFILFYFCSGNSTAGASVVGSVFVFQRFFAFVFSTAESTVLNEDEFTS